MVRTKFRIRFRKAGDLRLVSHHDLMRCFERMLRRAELPFHSTQGFNPRPRLVFALSLALGVIGCEEVVELELDADLPAAEVHDRLARQAPAGLEFLSVAPVARRSTAQVRLVCYRVALAPEDAAGLAERAAGLLAGAECWVERTRPQPRRVNLRPYLSQLRVLSAAAAPAPPPGSPPEVGAGGTLEMDILVTPTGTARPEEVLRLLHLDALLARGVILERCRMELHDANDCSVPVAGGRTHPEPAAPQSPRGTA
jgi:radical SAM-linked protein